MITQIAKIAKISKYLLKSRGICYIILLYVLKGVIGVELRDKSTY